MTSGCSFECHSSLEGKPLHVAADSSSLCVVLSVSAAVNRGQHQHTFHHLHFRRLAVVQWLQLQDQSHFLDHQQYRQLQGQRSGVPGVSVQCWLIRNTRGCFSVHLQWMEGVYSQYSVLIVSVCTFSVAKMAHLWKEKSAFRQRDTWRHTFFFRISCDEGLPIVSHCIDQLSCIIYCSY